MRAVSPRLACLGLLLSFVAACGQEHASDTNVEASDGLRLGTCRSAWKACGENALCENVGDKHRCTCAPGYVGDGMTCTPVAGSRRDGGHTSPPDAGDDSTPPGIETDGGGTAYQSANCSIDHGGCSADAWCDDTPSGPACTCFDGYTGDGHTCSLIPATDCTIRHGDCSYYATCTDTPAGPSCTCPAGFIGDGKTCAWQNPCAQNPCDYGATCEAYPPSTEPSCVCKYPLKQAPDGSCHLCLPECDASKHLYCLNDDGGPDTDLWHRVFWCQCQPGWSWDAFMDACIPN